MPEIKNTFTGGRMNKDLDERIITNGEYRDAMNIQVSTSEGSDVGSVQNILGNKIVNPSEQEAISQNATCVGSIADEKNNSTYWFVEDPTPLNQPLDHITLQNSIVNKGARYYYKDMIMRYTENSLLPPKIEYVFVDVYLTFQTFDTEYYSITGFPPINTNINSIFVDSPKGLRSGMSLSYVDILGNNHFPSNLIITNIAQVSLGPGVYSYQLTLSESIKLSSFAIGYLRFEGKRVLNFDKTKLITGINIISSTKTNEVVIDGNDDLLFWTNNNDEPKKINIPRSIAGTVQDGWHHTKLVVPTRNITTLNNLPALRKDITVIKKSPKHPPVLEKLARRYGCVYADLTHNFDGVNPGDTVKLTVNLSYCGTLNIKSGDVILLQDWAYNASQFDFPIELGAHDARLLVTEYLSSSPTKITCKVLSLSSGILRSQGAPFVLELDQYVEKLFGLKFPRFSFRYKYEDGEYSTFGPFSEVAFIPDTLDYDFSAKKGYNLGMENQLKELTISNIVTSDIPEEVVQVDILYKESNSPNIYLVEQVKVDDPLLPDGSNNIWNQNKYTIDSKTIHAVLPENQLLRPWDNVPRMALAQEIVGNRLVYGNYIQNYDLKDIYNNKVSPTFKVSLSEYYNSAIWKSVKSMRDYQLGIVYLDEFGRETPVLTDPTGSFKVSKLSGDKRNTIAVIATSLPPSWAESFKYFIKETSSEYYNLSMDRWYDAEDGNVWLSFPSSDRNKLDIESHIILKKVHNSNELITENAKYSVIDIKNEAPDFIKTSLKQLGRVDNLLSTTINALGNPSVIADKFPSKDNFSFQVRAYAIDYLSPQKYSTGYTSLGDSYALKDYFPSKTQDVDSGATNKLGAPKLMVRFINIGANGTFLNYATEWYEVSGIAKSTSKDYDDWLDIRPSSVDLDPTTTAISSNDVYDLELVKPFGTDVDWMQTNPGNPTTQVLLPANGYIRMEIAQEVVENKAEFDGRFFVKIERDGVISDRIIGSAMWDDFSTEATITLNYVKDFTEHDPLSSVYAQNLDTSTGYPAGTLFTGASAGSVLVDKTKHATAIKNITNSDMENGDSQAALCGVWSNPPLCNALTPGTGGLAPDISNSFGCPASASGGVGWDYGETCIQGKKVPENSYWSWFIWKYIFEVQRGGTAADPSQYQGDVNEHWRSSGFTGWTNNTGATNWFIDEAFYVCEDQPWDISAGIAQARTGSNFVWGGANWVGGYGSNQGLTHIKNRSPRRMAGFTSLNSTFAWTNDLYSTNLPLSEYYYWGKGKGMYNNTIEISYLGTGDNYIHRQAGDWDNRIGEDVGADYEDMWNILPGNDQEAQDFIDKCIPGAFCRFTNDNSRILRIKSVHKYYLSNYSEHSMDNLFPLAHYAADTNACPTFWDGISSYPNNFPRWESVNDLSAGITNILASKPSADYWTKTFWNTMWRQPWNRRLNLVITLDDTIKNPGYNGQGYDPINGGIGKDELGVTSPHDPNGFPGVKTPHGFEIVKGHYYDTEQTMSENPAIWETEPREDLDLDIYYEIGQNFPVKLEESNWNALSHFKGAKVYIERDSNSNWVVDNNALNWYGGGGIPIPIGSIIPMNITWFGEPPEVVSTGKDEITLIKGTDGTSYVNDASDPAEHIVPDDILYLVNEDGSALGVKVASTTSINGYGTVGPIGGGNDIIKLDRDIHSYKQILPYNNCYSFGNGVESDRIRDDFNQITIGKGVVASSVVEEKYKEEHRKSGLIYSGIYNSTSSVNNLNQFIAAEKITKDLNPDYGSIQKISTRDSDLVTLCEDKCLRVLANKDALFNADGNMQLTSTNNVLGQAVPFKGDFGISRNPESFATESFRMYFTDKQRGAVMRLSMDGLTPISDHGMKDWFKDNLKLSDIFIGSYDSRNDEYNITLDNSVDNVPKTVSFREDVRGWVSFKSFIPENGVSCANNYFTVDDGKLYKHYDETVDRNTFYNNQFTSSSLEVILNESSEIVKSFNTLHYEGTQSHVKQFIEYINPRDGITYTDTDFHNIGPDKDGWYVERITTDMQDGNFNEFIEKEGKWFNYIKGTEIPVSADGKITGAVRGKTHDTSEFSWQGIGRSSETPVVTTLAGCTDPAAINADCATLLHPNWITTCNDGVGNDDGSCVYPANFLLGCRDDSKGPYPSLQGLDRNNAACTYPCTYGFRAANYDGLATFQPANACNYLGCIDPNMFNYDPTANMQDPINPCIPFIYGCTASTFYNYDNTANTPCSTTLGYGIYGCFANSPCNGPGNNECCERVTPGCTNSIMFNYDPLANTDDGSCIPIILGCMNSNMIGYDPLANTPDNNMCSFNCPTMGMNTWTVPSSGWVNNLIITFGASSGYGVPPNGEYEFTVITPTTSALGWQGSGLLHASQQTQIQVPFNFITDPGSYTFQGTINWPGGETNGETCGFEMTLPLIPGCTDLTASNYNSNATVNDGNCIQCNIQGCMDGSGNSNNLPSFVPGSLNPLNSGTLDCTLIPYYDGTSWIATNGQATNFDSTAECNDPGNPCEYWGCRTTNASNYSACYTKDCSGNNLIFGMSGYDGSCCDYVGCTDDRSGCFPELEFQPPGTMPPVIGRCRGIITSGTYAGGDECPPYTACCGAGNGYAYPLYSSSYTINTDPNTGIVASCGTPISGCKDPSATNFDPCAQPGNTCGDGSGVCIGCSGPVL